MSEINYPAGFPLEPVDRSGNQLNVGDKIRILEISDWLVQDLPENEARAIKNCSGKEMLIFEIDNYGYLWTKFIHIDNDVDYVAQSFAIEPRNVLKV